jgi:mycothiol system anti-sigma-R factor
MDSEQSPSSGSERGHSDNLLGDDHLGPYQPEPSEVVYEPCQEAIATLYNFLDGELTPERRQQIQHHLDDCSPCFEAFGFEAELKAVIARNCRDEVPETLRQRVAEALRAEDARA